MPARSRRSHARGGSVRPCGTPPGAAPLKGPVVRPLAGSEVHRAHDIWRDAGLHFRPDGRDAPEAMAAEIEAGRTVLLGAFEGDDLVGVALVTHDGRKGFINRLAIRPAARRRGIARALVAEAEARVAAAGIGLVAVLVEEGNGASLALFERAGYVLRRDVLYLRKELGDVGW